MGVEAEFDPIIHPEDAAIDPRKEGAGGGSLVPADDVDGGGGIRPSGGGSGGVVAGMDETADRRDFGCGDFGEPCEVVGKLGLNEKRGEGGAPAKAEGFVPAMMAGSSGEDGATIGDEGAMILASVRAEGDGNAAPDAAVNEFGGDATGTEEDDFADAVKGHTLIEFFTIANDERRVVRHPRDM